MTRRQPLPAIWLVSDARNDAGLEAALDGLPAASGFVFRHYHLDEAMRKRRYDGLFRLCRNRGHRMILAGDTQLAAAWCADGIYAPPGGLGEGAGLLRLATVHDAAEVALADRAGADGMFLSPVFPTRSHPGAACLGVEGFHALAARAKSPVIALGGMNAARAAELNWPRWAGIDAFLR
jgi:thiamine-phosphate pyrophosphorylase